MLFSGKGAIHNMHSYGNSFEGGRCLTYLFQVTVTVMLCIFLSSIKQIKFGYAKYVAFQ